jgi:hypothetical protein
LESGVSTSFNSVFTAVTSAFWILSLAVGATGGVLNAVLARHTRLFPSLMNDGDRVAHVGVVGNVAVGIVMSATSAWLLDRAGCRIVVDGAVAVFPMLITFLLAFVTARAVTNEADKVTLRGAVYRAAGAPAAHPDTIRAMENAPLSVLSTLVDELVPRRVGHR